MRNCSPKYENFTTSKVACFISVDPLQFKYADLTPFQYASNAPISYIDLDGAEADNIVDEKNEIDYTGGYFNSEGKFKWFESKPNEENGHWEKFTDDKKMFNTYFKNKTPKINGALFDNPQEAYKFLYSMSFSQDKNVEMTAFIVEDKNHENKVLVLPWYANSIVGAKSDFFGAEYRDKNIGSIKYNGELLFIKAHIHTHPLYIGEDPKRPSYQGPSGYKDNVEGEINSGDLFVYEVLFSKRIPMYIIGKTEVSKINPKLDPFLDFASKTKENPFTINFINKHKIGKSSDLLKGKLNLLNGNN